VDGSLSFTSTAGEAEDISLEAAGGPWDAMSRVRRPVVSQRRTKMSGEVEEEFRSPTESELHRANDQARFLVLGLNALSSESST
jgi:hypothetical protein